MDTRTADAFRKLLAAAEAIEITGTLRLGCPSPEQWEEFSRAIQDSTAFLVEMGVICAKCTGCGIVPGPPQNRPCPDCEGKGHLS